MGHRWTCDTGSRICTCVYPLGGNHASWIPRGPTLVVDVRTAEEFAEGHFPGAINIPHEDIIQGIRALNVDKDQTILLYCRSGNRSDQAEIKLQSSGFSGDKKCRRSRGPAGRHWQKGNLAQLLISTTGSKPGAIRAPIFEILTLSD